MTWKKELLEWRRLYRIAWYTPTWDAEYRARWDAANAAYDAYLKAGGIPC